MGKKRKSSFASRVAPAHETHKGDETKVGGGGDLPAGIDHGVARLSKCHIGIYGEGTPYEGEPFFYASGTVLSPETVSIVDPGTKKSQIVPVQGLPTTCNGGPIPLCDTTSQAGKETPLEEHWSRVLNHLRLLGINTEEIGPDDIVAEPEEGKYESGPVLEALLEAAPTFKFRTWQGKPTAQYPNPRVNHDWRGICSWEEDGSDPVEAAEEEEPKWESEAEEEAAPEEASVEDETDTEELPDFLALAKVADKSPKSAKGVEASQTLSAYAEAAGVEDYEDIPTWVGVAEAIIAANEGGGEADEEFTEEEEESFEEEWVPTEGELGVFAHPKTGDVEVEFISVDLEAEKADVRRNDTKRVTKGVPFKLLRAE